MTRGQLIIAVAATIALGACNDAASPGNGASPSAQAASIEGTWRTPATTVEEEGVKMTSTESVATYAAGGASSFSLSMSVEANGKTTPIRVSGTGTWRREGNLLHQQMTDVTVAADTNDPDARALIAELQALYSQRPQSVGEIVELTPTTLSIRDRATGNVVTSTR